jgi:hypothetical protein
LWPPLMKIPPWTSRATPPRPLNAAVSELSGHAISIRHFLIGWNLCSNTGSESPFLRHHSLTASWVYAGFRMGLSPTLPDISCLLCRGAALGGLKATASGSLTLTERDFATRSLWRFTSAIFQFLKLIGLILVAPKDARRQTVFWILRPVSVPALCSFVC